jgi:ketosteroid isomerase-like protein
MVCINLKTMKKIYYMALAAVILVTSCQSKKQNVNDDITALRKLSEEAIAAFRAKDVDQLLSQYSKDAIEMPPNESITVGIEAITKAYETWFSDTTYFHEKFTETLDKIEVSESGDLGYVRTTSRFFRKTPYGDYEQKNIYIYKKIEGEWKCIIAIWNDNAPLKN